MQAEHMAQLPPPKWKASSSYVEPMSFAWKSAAQELFYLKIG